MQVKSSVAWPASAKDACHFACIISDKCQPSEHTDTLLNHSATTKVKLTKHLFVPNFSNILCASFILRQGRAFLVPKLAFCMQTTITLMPKALVSTMQSNLHQWSAGRVAFHCRDSLTVPAAKPFLGGSVIQYFVLTASELSTSILGPLNQLLADSTHASVAIRQTPPTATGA